MVMTWWSRTGGSSTCHLTAAWMELGRVFSSEGSGTSEDFALRRPGDSDRDGPWEDVRVVVRVVNYSCQWPARDHGPHDGAHMQVDFKASHSLSVGFTSW